MKYNQNNTEVFWDSVADEYNRLYIQEEDNYSPLYYRLEIIKQLLPNLPKGKAFDAGCGGGVLLEYLLKNGYNCAGCDLSSKMVQNTKDKIKKVTDEEVMILNTSLDKLHDIKNSQFDIVFSLGVFTYISDELEEKSYLEIKRILKPNGIFISGHQNELFNLYSMNKYTINFYDNFFELFKDKVDRNELSMLKKDFEKLLRDHNKPNVNTPSNKNENKSTRDYIFRREENPLTYNKKLTKYGFESMDNYYYNFHAMPPSIRNTNKLVADISKSMEVIHSKSWQAMFMCSAFINISRNHKTE